MVLVAVSVVFAGCGSGGGGSAGGVVAVVGIVYVVEVLSAWLLLLCFLFVVGVAEVDKLTLNSFVGKLCLVCIVPV